MCPLPVLLREGSLIWGGTTIGDVVDFGAYSGEMFMYYLNAMAGNNNPRRYGVLYTNHSSYSGCLAPSNPSGTTLRIANGAALAWRYLYLNTSNVDFSCAAIGYYNILLRVDKSSQTVRLLRRGHSTKGYPPAQRHELYNEISLALVYSDGATLTVTDTRRFFGNIVAPVHWVGTSWGDGSGARAGYVSQLLIEVGSHPPEAVAMINSCTYNCVQSFGQIPVAFFQAYGSRQTVPVSTKLTADQVTDQPNYHMESIDNLGAVSYLMVGTTPSVDDDPLTII